MSESETQDDAGSETGSEEKKKGLFRRMKEGLSRSAKNISEGVTGIFTKRKLDDETLEELEDLLISADLGIDAASKITAQIRKDRFDKEVSPEEIREALASEIADILRPVEKPFEIDATKKPYVLLMVGVNGAGKTTTIGKIGAKLIGEGKSVILAAGDTFRAAAVEQLKVWGERIGAPVVTTKLGGDAAVLAYEAIARAKEEGADVVLIDTAGRLQNKADLMAELEKVIRVVKKIEPEAPHATLLVLDATTGQNAVNQVEIFGSTAGVTGLVMTKLDGTARGGILVAIAEKFSMPVHMIGVGESVEDLQTFSADAYAKAIAGAN